MTPVADQPVVTIRGTVDAVHYVIAPSDWEPHPKFGQQRKASHSEVGQRFRAAEKEPVEYRKTFLSVLDLPTRADRRRT